jgi:hypothetical protein
MKLGILDFDHFVKEILKEQLLKRYQNLEILTEADFQAWAFLSLFEYFQSSGPAGKRFKVLNKPYLRDLHTFPDIAVFKRERPWALFELKERLHLPLRVARKARTKLLSARSTLGPSLKRGYLLYVMPHDGENVLRGPKGEGAHYFFEVPIVLSDVWPDEAIETFVRKRKKWAKYRSNQPNREVG